MPSAWLNERILVDAIIGRGFKTVEHAETMRVLGLARFTGNQWNPDWEWVRAALEKQSLENLVAIYENSLPNAPVMAPGSAVPDSESTNPADH